MEPPTYPLTDAEEATLDDLLYRVRETADPDAGWSEEIDALHAALQFCLDVLEFGWPDPPGGATDSSD